MAIASVPPSRSPSGEGSSKRTAWESAKPGEIEGLLLCYIEEWKDRDAKAEAVIICARNAMSEELADDQPIIRNLLELVEEMLADQSISHTLGVIRGVSDQAPLALTGTGVARG